MKIKNTEICVVRSDITSLRVDAIVNPSNTALTMEEGLAGIIAKKAGSSAVKQARRKSPVRIGSAAWTKAGTLKARYIIHAVTSGVGRKTDERKVRCACANALLCAHRLKVRSMAFPDLGCSLGGLPVVGAAKIMTQELLKFVRSNKTTLKKVVFCLLDRRTFTVFNKTIYGYLRHVLDDLSCGPYVTVDAIIEFKKGIVLIERSNPPYGWALPGGFVDCGESLEDAVVREAKEETNLSLTGLRQLHTYSNPKRDQRFHTISTVFVACGHGKPRFGDDAGNLKIVPCKDLLQLPYAFDHKNVIRDYLKNKGKTYYGM